MHMAFMSLQRKEILAEPAKTVPSPFPLCIQISNSLVFHHLLWPLGHLRPSSLFPPQCVSALCLSDMGNSVVAAICSIVLYV